MRLDCVTCFCKTTIQKSHSSQIVDAPPASKPKGRSLSFHFLCSKVETYFVWHRNLFCLPETGSRQKDISFLDVFRFHDSYDTFLTVVGGRHLFQFNLQNGNSFNRANVMGMMILLQLLQLGLVAGDVPFRLYYMALRSKLSRTMTLMQVGSYTDLNLQFQYQPFVGIGL